MRKQTVSVKLKLEHDKEQAKALRALATAYVSSLNYASQRAFELGKTSTYRKLHDSVYTELRSKFGIGSQMGCSCSQQVTSSYKTLWQTAKKHAANRKAGKTKKRYKGLDKPPKYSSPTVTFQYGRDYSWSKDQQVSVATLDGRIKLKYHGWSRYLELIRAGTSTGAAKLWYDKTSKQWYLVVSMEFERADINPKDLKKVKGVDVGQRCLYVSTDTENKTIFKHGGHVKQKCGQYARVRSGMQEKGTRSAKKALTRLAYRERRFRSNVNHKLAKSLVEDSILIGMEDLKDCTQNTMRKRRRGKKASEKQRKVNRGASSWAYAELKAFVAYKAFFADSLQLDVDAKNTSKGCRKCGHVSDKNRPKGALVFKCVSCGHTAHSDKNGADNILVRTLTARQSLTVMGCLSATPGVETPVAKGNLRG